MSLPGQTDPQLLGGGEPEVGGSLAVADDPPGLQAVVEAFSDDQAGPLRDRAYRAIRRAILTGQLPVAEKIPELDLAGALQISRTPLREAFRLLEAEGLVSPSPSRGVVVRGLNPRDLDEIYEMRESLEPLAARLAAQRATPRQLEQLGGRLELGEFFLARHQLAEAVEQEVLFHDLVYQASGNSRLRATLRSFHEFLRCARPAAARSLERSTGVLLEHRQMYLALASHDGEAAAAASLEHLVKIRRRDATFPDRPPPTPRSDG